MTPAAGYRAVFADDTMAKSRSPDLTSCSICGSCPSCAPGTGPPASFAAQFFSFAEKMSNATL